MKEKIPYSDFEKLDLRVGKIIDAKEHPSADKLLVLTVDLGEEEGRVIVAGLKKYYTVEELIGKKAVFVANLEPVKLRGIESNGMILAATGEDGEVVFIAPERDVSEGSKIK